MGPQVSSIDCAGEGARVVVCDLSPEWIEDTVERITGLGGDAMAYTADVRNIAALRAMVDATVKRWDKVDCLVNNAGIVMDAQHKNMTEEQFDRVIEINLKGVYNCTKAVVDTMLRQRSGVILNASSIVGLKSPPRAPGQARGDRQHLRLPRFRRGELHQRRGDRGERRTHAVGRGLRL